MGLGEKIKGEVKKVAGKVVDDPQLEAEGDAQADKGDAELAASKARAEAEAHEAKADLKEAEQEAHER